MPLLLKRRFRCQLAFTISMMKMEKMLIVRCRVSLKVNARMLKMNPMMWRKNLAILIALTLSLIVYILGEDEFFHAAVDVVHHPNPG